MSSLTVVVYLMGVSPSLYGCLPNKTLRSRLWDTHIYWDKKASVQAGDTPSTYGSSCKSSIPIRKGGVSMTYPAGAFGYGYGYGAYTSIGVILVLFILLVIILIVWGFVV
jgi:hypothetical protein